MTGELQEKVAIITGGASGIGRGSVAKFLEEGASVVIADVNAERGEAYARELGSRAAFHQTDVSRAEDVERVVDFAVSHFGDLHIMFNNAGISGKMGNTSLLEEEFADFEPVMRVDLLGVMLGTKYAGRHMVKNKVGSIINTASTGGMAGGFGIACYRAAKAGVLNFTQVAAMELGAHNVRVNSISPGPIETPIISGGVQLPLEQAQKLQRDVLNVMARAQALRRLGQPDDIGNAAIFLGSDRSAQITGHNLVVSGGIGAGDPSNRMNEIVRLYTEATARDSPSMAQEATS
jgi:NAD(P)-dependent dehydrogenase (short-subunit alcohol dehydrogenase family)